MEDNINDYSDFNSNKASLMRVDKLIRLCHLSVFQSELLEHYKYLRSLRLEARYKMDQKHKDECDTLFKDLSQTYEQVKMYIHHPPTRFEFEQKLDKFQVFLMDFMGKKGMLLTDKKDVGL